MSTTTTAPSALTSGRRRDAVFQDEIIASPGARKVLAVARIAIGFSLLWGFVDKVFGLGYQTPAERAWVNGGTPAQGYIRSIEGPFAGFFQGAFQNALGDWLFMAGILAIGVAVLLGAGLRLAAVSGTLLMATLYLTQLPWVSGGTNPLVDIHWINAILLCTVALTLAGDTWGVGRIWGRIVGNSWLR